MKKAYYARPISIDNTLQFERDKALIRSLGYEPWPTDEMKVGILERYRSGEGMEAFKESVQQSDLLIFRAFPDGSIGAGVHTEIKWAIGYGIPVVEFPRQIERRALSVADTREMLTELGQR